MQADDSMRPLRRTAVGGTVVDMAERQAKHRGGRTSMALGEEDRPASHRAALGAGGVDGWWTWKHRRRMRRGVDSVSPATWRGTLHVLVWFAGLAAITMVGSAVVAWPRPRWFLIALVVMVGVGWMWDRRAQQHFVKSDAPMK